MKTRCWNARLVTAVLCLLSSTGQSFEPREIVFTASVDQTEQRYVVIEPTSFNTTWTGDVLIALHGHGSDRWQFATSDRDECRACRDMAAKYQMLFVSPDYRAKTSWMGPKAEADVVQIIGEIKSQHQVRRVFFAGASMGGSSALTFAAIHPDMVDGVSSMNGTANHLEYLQFQDAIAESFGGSKVTIPDEFKKRSAEYWPERLTMPIGLATGGKDELVPSQSVERLANVLRQLNRPVLHLHREAGGHSTNYQDAAAILEYMIKEAE